QDDAVANAERGGNAPLRARILHGPLLEGNAALSQDEDRVFAGNADRLRPIGNPNAADSPVEIPPGADPHWLVVAGLCQDAVAYLHLRDRLDTLLRLAAG